jgi:hypothetical protein
VAVVVKTVATTAYDGSKDTDGLKVGSFDGSKDTDGLKDGSLDGSKDTDGLKVGSFDGSKDTDGLKDGSLDGLTDGSLDGSKDMDGLKDGSLDGSKEGSEDGAFDDFDFGVFVDLTAFVPVVAINWFSSIFRFLLLQMLIPVPATSDVNITTAPAYFDFQFQCPWPRCGLAASAKPPSP